MSTVAGKLSDRGSLVRTPKLPLYIGSANEISEVAEYTFEMLCKVAKINAAVAALTAAHPYPYEELAYDVMALVDI